MRFENILITGGAGFVGSNLSVLLKQRLLDDVNVMAVDNLHRRGSELSLSRLSGAGVHFFHGDIRCLEDVDALPDFDLLIDCAAEASVTAGMSTSPRQVLSSNLTGTLNCLEVASERGAGFLFLSTSRVYPIALINALPYREESARFTWEEASGIPGFSTEGIAESFSLEGARSFYGSSKLSAELIVQEYAHGKGLKAIINRCGVLAGPWQMGKVDQGIVTLWVARHLFGRPLSYMGFGGEGKQVRDILHVEDLFELIAIQMQFPEKWDGRVYNVGGGLEGAVSLLDLTALCREASRRSPEIRRAPETSPVDIRIYITDARKAHRDFGWRPSRRPRAIVEDIYSWIEAYEDSLKRILE